MPAVRVSGALAQPAAGAPGRRAELPASPRPTPRPRRGPLFSSVAVCLAAGLVAGLLAGRGRAPANPSAEQLPSPAAVDALLAARAHALLTHDAAALAETASPRADAAVRDAGARLRALPLTAWSYSVARRWPDSMPGSVDVEAVVHYRVGPDRVDATARRRLVVEAGTSGGGPRVRNDDPVGAALPWDVGATQWSSTAAAAVLVVVPPTGAARTASTLVADVLSTAGNAAHRVTAVWGTSVHAVPVVVVVADAPALARLVGRTPAQVAGAVAVTTPDRVVVDLSAYASLAAAGGRVLLTHELTHLATGSASDDHVPLWLEEGFADEVGFAGSGIAVRSAAATLLAQVRRHGPPTRMPTDGELDGAEGASREAQAYAGAWLLCRLVAQRAGTPALVAVYRATAAGHGRPLADLDHALRSLTGRPLRVWVAAWRAELRRLAA